MSPPSGRSGNEWLGLVALALIYVASSSLVTSATAQTSPDLLGPFGVRLGASQADALAFRGDPTWNPPKPDDSAGGPISQVRIDQRSGPQFYTLTFWEGRLARIERNGFFGHDNAQAENVYKGLFSSFVESLRRLGYKGEVAYGQNLEKAVPGKKAVARLHPHSGGAYDIAQFEYALYDLAASQQIDDHRRSLATKAKTQVVRTGRYIAMNSCHRYLQGKTKQHYLEVGVLTEIGIDLPTCRLVAQSKRQALKNEGWQCSDISAEDECNDEQMFVNVFDQYKALQKAGYTYLRFKDADQRVTIMAFMHSGSMMPICLMYKQGLEQAGFRAECIDSND